MSNAQQVEQPLPTGIDGRTIRGVWLINRLGAQDLLVVATSAIVTMSGLDQLNNRFRDVSPLPVRPLATSEAIRLGVPEGALAVALDSPDPALVQSITEAIHEEVASQLHRVTTSSRVSAPDGSSMFKPMLGQSRPDAAAIVAGVIRQATPPPSREGGTESLAG